MANPQRPKTVTDMRPQRLGGPPAQQPQQSRQVFIDPRVTQDMLQNPATAAYAAGLGARAAHRAAKAGQLPKYQQEVGGGPVPPIPLLDQEAAQGMPMAAQAALVNQMPHEEVMAQMGQAVGPGSIVEPPMHIPRMNQAQHLEQAVINSIQPGDMLPAEAQQDPTFQRGAGALFAANQPHLVLKYGLVRQGVHIPPQELARSRKVVPGQLSPQSIEGLQALQQHQQRVPDGMPKTEQEAESQAASSAAAQSARVGKKREKPLTEDERKRIQETIARMDSFDYDALQRQMEEDMLNNPEQREIIESRLAPLDYDELITKNKVSQDVIIHTGEEPGKQRLWFTYESMTGGEDLTLKQLIMQESKSIQVTGQYLLDKFAFMSIAIGLKAINGNTLPRHTDDKGKFNEDKFWLKFEWVLDRPLHLLSCIGINHAWFEQRVRKMFVVEKLKNG